MIPSEVAELAILIWPDWDADHLPIPAYQEVLESAWRIYNAGYRKPMVSAKT